MRAGTFRPERRPVRRIVFTVLCDLLVQRVAVGVRVPSLDAHVPLVADDVAEDSDVVEPPPLPIRRSCIASKSLGSLLKGLQTKVSTRREAIGRHVTERQVSGQWEKSGHTGTVDPGTGCGRVEALTSTFPHTVFRRSVSAFLPSRTTSACSRVQSLSEVGRSPVLPIRRSCQAVKAMPALSSRFRLRVSTTLQVCATLRRETLRVSARGSNGSPTRNFPTPSSTRMARRTPATRPMTVSMRAFSVGSTARLSGATRPSNAT